MTPNEHTKQEFDKLDEWINALRQELQGHYRSSAFWEVRLARLSVVQPDEIAPKDAFPLEDRVLANPMGKTIENIEKAALAGVHNDPIAYYALHLLIDLFRCARVNTPPATIYSWFGDLDLAFKKGNN